jgi:quercetin dioxygenase-like cupin family protein
LTTGAVQFLPGAALRCHQHPYAEAVVVVSGRLCVEVEGRRYVLSPGDGIWVPRDTPHAAANLLPGQPAMLKIAMATSAPSRVPVERVFPRREMPVEPARAATPERVVRGRPAGAAAAVPEKWRELSGAAGREEMACGCGVLGAGEELPERVLDSDVSLSVIRGTAVCRVEGRRHVVAEQSALFVPAGLEHAVANEGRRPLELFRACAPGAGGAG